MPLKGERLAICLETLNDRELAGMVLGSEPKQGMIRKDEALNIAINNNPRNYDTNQPPRITLIDDTYLIVFWRPRNPYRDEKRRDSIVGVDAMTGAFLGLLNESCGTILRTIDSKTGSGTTTGGSLNDSQKKLSDTLYELDDLAVREARLPMGSSPQPEMVSPENAIQVASEQVSHRNYDHNQKPQVALIGDVYVAIFWRDTNMPSRLGARYDTRVGIDAKTGKFIAMETTKAK